MRSTVGLSDVGSFSGVVEGISSRVGVPSSSAHPGGVMVVSLSGLAPKEGDTVGTEEGADGRSPHAVPRMIGTHISVGIHTENGTFAINAKPSVVTVFRYGLKTLPYVPQTFVNL